MRGTVPNRGTYKRINAPQNLKSKIPTSETKPPKIKTPIV